MDIETTKILVVDDSAVIRKSLTQLLKEAGAEVTTAEDGEQGIQKVKDIKPKLVILDLLLPKIPGEEVCKKIRKDNQIKDIPIIIISGIENVYSFKEPKFRELIPDKKIPEPFAFFEKPVNIPELVALIGNLFDSAK